MTRFESRWRDAMLGAMLPPGARHPGASGASLGAFWVSFADQAPVALRWGLRASLWAVQGLSLLRHLAPFERLAPEQQDALLRELASSRLYALRQIAFTLKHVACFAVMTDPAFRARVDLQ